VTRASVLSKVEVRPGDFVVDIGGGHRPFPRADLVLEKYPFDNSLHSNRPMLFPQVPVIKADAHALPIPDRGCELIFASHIIEHLKQPWRFIAEIQRCARRVYLEFPSRNRELMNAWSFHEWLVEAHGPVLKFYKNDLPQLFGPLFHAEHDAALGAWSEARHELLNTSICSESARIECEFPNETASELVLRDSPRGESKLNFAELINRPKYSLREIAAFAAQSMLSNGLYAKLAGLRGKEPSSPAPPPDAVVARLMCLRCRSTGLRRSGDEITCKCGAKYMQDRGVFDFEPQG